MSMDLNKGDSGESELLAFLIGSQEFCVNVMGVREIRGWTPAVSLPHSQGYMRGVVNLRGAILPIIDLAARLGFESAEPTDRHVIIVFEVGKRLAGVLVDAVTGIMNVSATLIQPPPSGASELARAWVEGIVVTDGRMITLLSLEQILPTVMEEIEAA